MKFFLSYIFLLGLTSCLASENDWIVRFLDGEIQEGHRQNIRLYQQDVNDHSRRIHPYHHNHHIERPCSIHDVKCIRQFFAKHSKCSPAYGPAPDPYIIKIAKMDIPHSNMSIITHNAKHIGLNTGRIKEFYINKKTDTLVLEVEFGKLTVDSPKTRMIYHRKGKESIEAVDFSIIDFNHLSLTLTVQHVNDIHPEKGHVYSYLPDPQPPLQVGPGLEGNSPMNLKWMNELGLTVREAMVSQGPLYMAVFLQSKICDFRHHS